MPDERLALGPRLARLGHPDIHRLRINVDDPVHRHALALVELPLHHAVRARAARAQHLGGQQEMPDCGPATFPGLVDGHDEDIGLHEFLRAPGDIGGGHEHFADRLAVQVLGEPTREPKRNPLVPVSRGGRHEQLAVHHFVARPAPVVLVVECADHVRRVGIEQGWHTHSFVSAAEEKQAEGTPHDGGVHRGGRHRIPSRTIITTHPRSRPFFPLAPTLGRQILWTR